MSSESSPMLSSQNGKIFLDQENEQLTINDASNNHVALAGKDSTGTVVFKVAKPGFNAITATNDQLIFNSSQNMFKIVKAGTITVVVSGGTGTTVVPHGLGYASAYDAYLTGLAGGAIFKMPYYGSVTSLGVFYVDTTNITASVTAADGTYTVKYYLMQETAN